MEENNKDKYFEEQERQEHGKKSNIAMLNKVFTFLRKHFLFTKITNPQEVSDPIIKSIEELEIVVRKRKQFEASEITKPLSEKLDKIINKEPQKEVKVSNIPDTKPELNAIKDAIVSEVGKIDMKPNVIVQPPEVTVKNDLSEFLKVFKDKKEAKDILKRLDKIGDSLDSFSMPEIESYTEILNRIAEVSSQKGVIEAISKIEFPKFKIPDWLISNKRIKVEVDRVGSGGGDSGFVFNKENDQINPATEEKQDAQITLSSPSTDLEGGGKVSVGTTAVEMTFIGETREITLTADSSNNDIIYWGKSNVTSDGSNAMGYMEANNMLTIKFEDSDNPIYVVANSGTQNVWKGAML